MLAAVQWPARSRTSQRIVWWPRRRRVDDTYDERYAEVPLSDQVRRMRPSTLSCTLASDVSSVTRAENV